MGDTTKGISFEEKTFFIFIQVLAVDSHKELDSSEDLNVSVLRNEFFFIIVGILELGKSHKQPWNMTKHGLLWNLISEHTYHECAGI